MAEQRYSPRQIEVMEDEALVSYLFALTELAGAVFAGVSAVQAGKALLNGEGGLPRLVVGTAVAVGLGVAAKDNVRYANIMMNEATQGLLASHEIPADSRPA